MAEGKQAVNQVGEHVKQQTDADDVEWLAKEQQNNIADHGIIGVQRVKANTAAVGLKYRCRQQVIQVNQYGQEQDEVRIFPFAPEENPGNGQRKNQM